MASFEEIAATWRPAPVTSSEPVTAGPALGLAGLFDTTVNLAEGEPLPPLWHWLYLLDRPAQAELAEDGHPRSGYALPPLTERRRVFGGGRVAFRDPILIGDVLHRGTSVSSVRARQGASGPLLLVTVRHKLSVGDETRAVEEQDIVYRLPASGPSTRPVPSPGPVAPAAPWRLALDADARLLFRFSALTYNAHRIHYDRDFATTVEGYADLVVHGPLLALAMLELPRRREPRRVRTFSWRARSPLFVTDTITVWGDPDGELGAGRPGEPGCVTGSVTWGGEES
jgi:3-methylfumaryl-CoA hydratase